MTAGLSTPPHPTLPHPAGRIAVHLFAWLVCLVLFVPWEPFSRLIPSLDALSVDEAFIIAMPELFRTGAQYGPEVVFTYGPWGILATGVVPANLHPVVLLLRAGIAAVAALIVATTILRPRGRPALQAVLAFSFLVMAGFWITGIEQGYWYLPSLYLGLCHVIRREGPMTKADLALAALATIASAWIGLIKFNFFLFGLCIQLVVLLTDVAFRRPPALFALWAGTTVLAWAAAGQSLGNLPSWILACLDLSGGYADAMSKGLFTPYGPPIVGLLLFGLLCFLVTALGVAARARTRRVAAAVFAVCALTAALAWQHAIGGNQIEQGICEVLAALWLLVALLPPRPERPQPERPSRRLWPAVSALLTVALFAAVVEGASGLPYRGLIRETLIRKAEAATTLLDQAVSRRPHPGPDPWEALMTSVRTSVPIATSLTGTADVYPQHTAVVIAHPGFRYVPRPAYLSLNAHTTNLAERNADHLRTAPPDVVLFQVLHPSRAVNNRHPATADGPSWPELIARYAVHDATNEFLVLKRMERPIPYRFVPMESASVRWDEELRVDDEKDSGQKNGGQRLVWARLHVRPSLIGRLAKAVYKAPHVTLEQTLADGSRREDQIVPALGEAGFLMSPSVSDTLSFARLMQGTAVPGKAVVSVRLKTEAWGNWFWTSETRVELFELVLDGEIPRALPAGLAGPLRLDDLRLNAGPCLFPPSPETIAEASGPAVLFHAPCATRIQVPPNSHGATLSYGMRYVVKPGEPVSDGADVRVSALDAAGTPVAAQVRVLDPTVRPEDRGEQRLELSWSPGAATELRINFGAGPKGNPNYDHTYISGLAFRRDEAGR
ncbi:hypothetical protein [Azospirillum argentinense]